MTVVAVGLRDHHIQYLKTLNRTRSKALRKAIEISMQQDGFVYVPARWEQRDCNGSTLKTIVIKTER
jgi:hypothetical protein